MKLKKVGSAVLATMLTCSLSVTPVFADEVSDLKDQKAQAQSEMNNLQSQLNTLMNKMSDLENELIETGEEISKTEEDLKAAEEDQEKQYDAMKLRIKYMYEEGTGTATMEKVLTSGDMSSILSQAEYSQQVHEYDREKLDEYIATTEKVKELKNSLEEKQDNLEATQVEFEAQQSELNTTISEKSEEISSLDGMIQEAARKAAEEAARKKAEEEAKKKAAAERQQKRKHPRRAATAAAAAVDLQQLQLKPRSQRKIHILNRPEEAITEAEAAVPNRPTAQAQETRSWTVHTAAWEPIMYGAPAARELLTAPDL